MADIHIRDASDIATALSEGMDRGGMLVRETELGPAFFDLTTGLAGELFQRFTNYRVRLAIVLTDAHAHGARFNDLVHEHRTHPTVRFFATEQDARRWLAYNPVVRC